MLEGASLVVSMEQKTLMLNEYSETLSWLRVLFCHHIVWKYQL